MVTQIILSTNIVGKETEDTQNIIKALNKINIPFKAHGFLNDKELNNLYLTSHFCFFLSRNEGYGLPLIESLWFKLIPIISNIPAFNEILPKEYSISRIPPRPTLTF